MSPILNQINQMSTKMNRIGNALDLLPVRSMSKSQEEQEAFEVINLIIDFFLLFLFFRSFFLLTPLLFLLAEVFMKLKTLPS